MQTISFAENEVIFVTGLSPKLTVAPITKLFPLSVTEVPPATAPWLGKTSRITGGGANTKVNLSLSDIALVFMGVVTCICTIPPPV